MSKRNILSSCNDSSSNNSSNINSRYGTSLLIGVIFIFATRLPSQLTPFILPEKKPSENSSTFNQILYVLLNLPLLICSLLNPWMYAYHNLDLKPVMRRLVKKFCRKLVRKDYTGNEARFRKTGNAENQSFMTGYNAGQISMFASVPRRSTFLHNSAGGAAVLATTPVATAPIQPPIHPVLKTQRSVSSMLRNSFHTTKTKKARRTKSCAVNNQGGKIPIVTIWDGNTVKDVTKPEEEML